MKLPKILLGLAVLASTPFANAAVCQLASDNPLGNQPIVATMPLMSGNITVGRDVPVGQVVYQQTFNPPVTTRLYCTNVEPDSVLERNYFSATPLPLSPWSGGAYGGKTYESGVPGIGVVITHNSDVLPYNWQFRNCDGSSNCTLSLPPWTMTMTINLIKIGPVEPGTINASNFPSVIRDIITSVSLKTMDVKFSGTINVVSHTCITPDVPVPMGTHDVREFKGRGSATAWRDFRIQLLNCPAFHGTVRSNGPVWTDKDNSTPGTWTRNVLSYSLAPTAGAIDPTNGVIALTPSKTGFAPSATGVGIQIANASSTPLALNTLHLYRNMPLGTIGGQSFIIPLRARYLQTADEVKPGPANGAVTFTIDYQ